LPAICLQPIGGLRDAATRPARSPAGFLQNEKQAYARDVRKSIPSKQTLAATGLNQFNRTPVKLHTFLIIAQLARRVRRADADQKGTH
jgi:hypothetical protein